MQPVYLSFFEKKLKHKVMPLFLFQNDNEYIYNKN